MKYKIYLAVVAMLAFTAHAQEELWKKLNAEAEELYQQEMYYEAIDQGLEALKVAEETLGPDDIKVATTLKILAQSHQNLGEYSEAEPLYNRALEIMETALGPDHPDLAQLLINLADLYRIQGQYTQAEPHYDRALAIRESALGPDHPDISTALNSLGFLYYLKGEYDRAEPLYNRALTIHENNFGSNHHIVAEDLYNLGVLYSYQGQYSEAESPLKRALAIREKTVGRNHPDVALLLSSLARNYLHQGQFAKAEPLFIRAITIYEYALGPDHPNVALDLNNLAALYKNQGNSKADSLYKRAQEINEKTLGLKQSDHVEPLSTLSQDAYSEPFKNRLALSILLGPGIPMGDFLSPDKGNHKSVGVSIVLEAEYYTTKQVSIGAAFWGGVHYDKDFGEDLKTSIFTGGGFIKYTLPMKGSSYPYAKLGLGWTELEFEQPGVTFKTGGGIAILTGLGVLSRVSDLISVNGQVTYNYSFVKDAKFTAPPNDVVGFDVQYISVDVGVSFYLSL